MATTADNARLPSTAWVKTTSSSGARYSKVAA